MRDSCGFQPDLVFGFHGLVNLKGFGKKFFWLYLLGARQPEA